MDNKNSASTTDREVRSFLIPRNPSVDRRFRPRPQRQIRLFDQSDCVFEENGDYSSSSEGSEDETATISSCTEDSAKSEEKDGAVVYLRLRPVDIPSASYSVSESGNVFVTGPSSENTSTSNNKNMMEKHFSFSGIFNRDVQQCEIYDMCVKPKILADENFTILAYGTSGSGKTFTLIGDDSNPGIIPRALENIFKLNSDNIFQLPSLKIVNGQVSIMEDAALAKEIRAADHIWKACGDDMQDYSRLQQVVAKEHAFETATIDDISVLIWVSFVEIYNEIVQDLLAPMSPSMANSTFSSSSSSTMKHKNLKIVCNDGKVFIKGVTSIFVKSSMEALKLLHYGLKRVNYASTSINCNSSRSHCIFFIDILKYCGDGSVLETSYKFCDLAGSERLHKTGNVGSRLKEAQRINTSLMILGRCLDAANAANKKRSNEIIPYRESKLTMLLQAALLGKEKLAMIVNVTPLDKYYEENLNVLNFASIARNIIFKEPTVKNNKSRYSFVMNCSKSNAAGSKQYVQQLLQENLSLRTELDRIKLDMETQLQTIIADLNHKHSMELMQQERQLRNTLVDQFEAMQKDTKVENEIAMQKELANQKRDFEIQMKELVRKHESALEDLRDEIEDLKQKRDIQLEEKDGFEDFKENQVNNGATAAKRRKTLE